MTTRGTHESRSARGYGIRSDEAIAGGDDYGVGIRIPGRGPDGPEDCPGLELPRLHYAVPVSLLVPIPRIDAHFRNQKQRINQTLKASSARNEIRGSTKALQVRREKRDREREGGRGGI